MLTKSAILDQTGISPEMYRQRLRKEQWLEPEGLTGPQVAEMVALEQFTQILPAGGKAWVPCHRPATLSAAVGLMEDYLAAEGAESSTWAWPLVLGRDWPEFREILLQYQPPASQMEGAMSPGRGLLGHTLEADPGEGMSMAERVPANTRHPSVEDSQTELERDIDFVREQREDPTLSRAWEQATVPGPEEDTSTRPPQGPWFEIQRDCLYRVVQEPRTPEPLRQLLVPRRLRQGLLQLVHANPWAGHLG
uniref:SCAN box domain-containing protein n=1 Tax=Chrysemys picta bellii TaxID=8478 RepID=A0A8C3IZK9_CHRPI